MKDIDGVVLWGGTGQARVVRDALLGGPEVVAVVDEHPGLPAPFEGVPLLQGEDALARWLIGRDVTRLGCLATVGGERGRVRLELQRRMAALGLAPVVAVHRTAFVAGDASIGAGSQILAQSAVCAAARLGDAVIVNTAASVDHECVLGDGVHVAPGARLAGCVVAGPGAFIGTGAIVLPRLRLGEGCVIGAGAVVLADVPAFTVVAGNPARPIGRREAPP